MKLTQTLLTTLTCLISLSAAAQWQWIDNAGRKVFSDRPPASDVPEKNILKQPNQRAKTGETSKSAVAPTTTGPQAAPAAPAVAKPGDGVDKGLLEKKKQAEAAEATKQKAEEERVAKIKAENCARAQQAKPGLDSGVRQSRLNESGEREYLDDATRAAESRRIQTIIDSDCR